MSHQSTQSTDLTTVATQFVATPDPRLQDLRARVPRLTFIEALYSIKLRWEKQPDEQLDLSAFIPVVSFAQLSTPNTQVVYGRNGTGKTHLLRAYRQHCRETYEDTRLLAVYIDCKDLGLGPEPPAISAPDLVLVFYRRFLDKIVKELRTFSESTLTVGRLDKLFHKNGQVRRESIDRSIAQIETLLNQVQEKLAEFKRTVTVEQERKSKLNAEAGATLDVSTSAEPEVGLHLGADISGEAAKANKQKIDLVYSGLAVIDYQGIRHELENIIENSGANSLTILLDEWASIGLPLQPTFAEMLRKTIAVSDRIVLKIAAIKHFTRLSVAGSTGQSVGLQIGIDISQLVDLDSLYIYEIDADGVESFLTAVAYKHACLSYPVLLDYGYDAFKQYLCDEVFVSSTAFGELVRASEGNPRDFLSMLGQCITILHLDQQRQISKQDIVKLAGEYFTSTKIESLRGKGAALALFNSLFNWVVKQREKMFLVRSARAQSDQRLRELWNARFLHIVRDNYSILTGDGVESFTVYSMDYGQLLSLELQTKGEEIVAAIAAGVDEISKSFGLLIPLGTLLKSAVGERFRLTVGKAVLREVHGQAADIRDAQYLLDHCVVDDLLGPMPESPILSID